MHTLQEGISVVISLRFLISSDLFCRFMSISPYPFSCKNCALPQQAHNVDTTLIQR